MKIAQLPETRGKTFLVDLDLTLCKENCFTPEECLRATPIQHMVDQVNRLWTTEFVVIYTARADSLIPATLEWLRRNNVRHHAISNQKVPGIYVDDRAITFDQFLSLGEPEHEATSRLTRKGS